jgi:exodeoxyribonuclease X
MTAVATAPAEDTAEAAKRRPRVLLFDTETTGTGDDAQIIESAWAFVESNASPLDLALGPVTVERFRPSVAIDFGAQATHHILESDLAECPPSSQFSMLPDLSYLVGHNIDYDWTVAGKPPIKRICTLALARRCWPELDNHKLGTLIYFLHAGRPKFARELLRDAHSAAVDVENLFRVLAAICQRTKPKSWRELWEQSEQARIPIFMPFGKYRPKKGEPGIPIAELPRDYLQWCLRQDDEFDPFVKIAARRAVEGPRP